MYLRFILLFVVSLSFASCGFDKKPKYPPIEKLTDGRYVVVGAKRNGTPTSTLNSGFYEIKQDSAFTNLSETLDSIATSYILKDNKITHQNPKALSFIVSKMTSDTLELNTELKGFDFELSLVKASTLENQE